MRPLETVMMTPEELEEIKARAARSTVTRVDVLDLIAEVKRLREENANLASWQCIHTDGKTGLVNTEHGHQICAKDATIANLTTENERLSARVERLKAAIPTHRHKKRGTEYTLIGEGRMQTDHWYGPNLDSEYDNQFVDMRVVSIYRGSDGQYWVRPVEEFNDGRFEALPAARCELEEGK